jgi:aquaporin Z
MNLREGTSKLVCEFLGVFALTLIGPGTIIATGGQDLVAIALAHGLALGLMIAAAGHVSGGVFNPAVAIGLMVTGKLPPARGALYIVAQVVGGVVAAICLTALFPAEARDAVRLGATFPGPGVTAGQALLAEVLLTFFLMFVVYGVAIDKRGPATIAGLAIGLTVAFDILMGGGISGAAMNTARWFGPALVGNTWDAAWVYVVGPPAGALIAALLYNVLLLPQEIPQGVTPTREQPIALPQADDDQGARDSAIATGWSPEQERAARTEVDR